ncbi:hypothetical protein [Rhodoferax sp.]|uniref:hypothetical protein n=1 Tax=Rhodoferax sp. TaxID=50421 RepID=UPI00374DED91
MKKLVVIALLALASGAQAESTAAKKELVNKVLLLQQPAIEQEAQALVARPVMMMLQRAEMILQSKVAADKREAVAKQIQVDVKQFEDEVVPMVRARSVSLAPSTVGALLDEKFTEDELKQLIAIIESPVNRKYLQMGGEIQKVLLEKLFEQTKPTIEPRMMALEQSISKHLGLPAPSAGAANAKPAPRKPASAKATSK